MPRSSRAGFTLIEMLVAVTLVLLMMVMFGEIFQIATGSVTKQRIMADNDQNVRTFVTVLRADLDKRTFRTLVPFFPGELSANPGTPFEKRRGYFYISNNNITDGTDDVLQFTTDVSVDLKNSDESLYYGHATMLPSSIRNPTVFSDRDRMVYLFGSPNQPERDDGQIQPNEAGSSRSAEVAYWLRGGRLYRRVMLLRNAQPAPGVDPTTNPSGSEDLNSNNNLDAGEDANGNGKLDRNLDFFDPASGFFGNEDINGNGVRDAGEDVNQNKLLDGNFWGEFDFSAHMKQTPPSAYAVLNGVDYLSNDLTVPPFAGFPWHPSLGQTWNRFGHNHVILANPVAPIPNGLPREFSATATPNEFIGRFRQQETSDARFQYPQRLSSPGGFNPMDTTIPLTVDSTGVVAQFNNGSRSGVDLLLSNVHEFRIEAWDQRIGGFAPIGHSIGAGDYNLGRQLNPTYLPLGGSAHIFDTWHPNFDRNFNIPSPTFLGDTADRPPFRALTWNPTVVTTDPSFPPGPTPVAPFRQGYWAPDTTYNIGDVVFPRTEDLNANGVLDAGEDGTVGLAPPFGVAGQPDDSPRMATLIPNKHPNVQFRPFGLTYAYRCIKAGHTLGSGPAGAFVFEPNWSSKPGFVIRGQQEDLNNDGILNAGDVNLDGDANAENEPDWVVDYNVRPLRAIRITVRFEHPQSKQMKQITIVHSLRDTTSVP